MRRGVSTVGPHRDDVELFIDGLPARTHASQGEQRTLALALRLAAHRLVADEPGSAPVLVLDDVLSELDPRVDGAARSPAAGQVVHHDRGAIARRPPTLTTVCYRRWHGDVTSDRPGTDWRLVAEPVPIARDRSARS